MIYESTTPVADPGIDRRLFSQEFIHTTAGTYML